MVRETTSWSNLARIEHAMFFLTQIVSMVRYSILFDAIQILFDAIHLSKDKKLDTEHMLTYCPK